MRTLVVCRAEAISDHVLSLVEMPAWFAYVLTSAHYHMAAGACSAVRSVTGARGHR